MDKYFYAVIYFPGDRTFECISLKTLVEPPLSTLFETVKSNPPKVSITVEYNLNEEDAFLIQIVQSKQYGEKLSNYCSDRKTIKKTSVETLFLKFEKLEPENRQRLTPIKTVTTEVSSDDDIDPPQISHLRKDCLKRKFSFCLESDASYEVQESDKV